MVNLEMEKNMVMVHMNLVTPQFIRVIGEMITITVKDNSRGVMVECIKVNGRTT